MLWKSSNEELVMYTWGSDLFLWGEWGNIRKENTICTEVRRENSCPFLSVAMVII